MASGDQAGTRRRRKKPDKETEKSQRERFIETARAIGADESREQFERAIQRIIHEPRTPKGRPATKPEPST